MFTNDPDTPVATFLALGAGKLAPSIAVSDSAYVELVTGETINHHVLTLSNLGGSDLQWQHVRSLDATGSPTAAVRVILDAAPVGVNSIHLGELADSGYSVEILDDPLAGFTQEMLDGADIVEMYQYRTYSAAEILRLATWIEEGGGLFCPMFQDPTGSLSALLAELGLGANVVDCGCSVEAMAPLVDHQLTQGVAHTYGMSTISYSGVGAPLVSIFRHSNGACTGAYGAVGKGRVFLTTIPIYLNQFANSESNYRLASNVYEWLAWNGPNILPESGTIKAGQSQVLDVQFSSVDVPDGLYLSSIALASNDPVRPLVGLSATYDVSGAGNLQVASDSYSMGVVYASRSTQMTVDLWNSGNGVLNIENIVSSNVRMTVTLSSMQIAPKGLAQAVIQVSPGPEGPESTMIAIETDAPGQDQVVFAVGAFAAFPRAAISTHVLDWGTVYTGSFGESVVTLSNPGLVPLDFLVTPDPSGSPEFQVWGSLSGSVLPNRSVPIIIKRGILTACTGSTRARCFEILSEAPSSPDTVSAFANYVPAPNLSASKPPEVQYEMPTNKAFTVALSNSGCGPLTVSGIEFSGDPGFSCTMPTVPFVVDSIDDTPISVTLGSWDPSLPCDAILRVTSDDPDLNCATWSFVAPAASLQQAEQNRPAEVEFSVRPNPFNPSATVEFGVDREGDVSINIYNLRGMLVRRLDVGHTENGRGSVIWDGRSAGGITAASGVYFLELFVDGIRYGKPFRAVLLK